MKRSKQDKQVIKDEADATERYEHPTGASGATAQNVGDIGHTEVGGATAQDYREEVEPKQSWFDRTFRSSEDQ